MKTSAAFEKFLIERASLRPEKSRPSKRYMMPAESTTINSVSLLLKHGKGTNRLKMQSNGRQNGEKKKKKKKLEKWGERKGTWRIGGLEEN
jgi:hypothetical protein